MRGSERARLNRESASPIQWKRIHFYVNEGSGVAPESGVGYHAHAVRLNNLYNTSKDPLNLWEQASREYTDFLDQFNWMEQEVVNLGFDGVFVPQAQGRQGVAVLIGDHKVNVDYLGMGRQETEVARFSTSRQQYDEVEAKYKGTDQWMKAPNGNPTNLTERQWVQVRTPKFKAWFGDWEKHASPDSPVGSLWSDDAVSKVVDENGEPLVVHHGALLGGFTEFDMSKTDKHRSQMMFAAEDRETAKSYSGKGREINLAEVMSLDEINGDYTVYETEDGYEIQDKYGDTIATGRTEKEVLNNFADASNHPRMETGIYSLFLNIRNPLESDFEGGNWDGAMDGWYSVYDADGEIVEADNGAWIFTENDAWELANKLGLEDVRQAPDNDKTTNTVGEEALEYGRDGAIIRNVVDDGGKDAYVQADDVFIFFDPKQAKSATQNTGQFGNNSDLRYSPFRAVDTESAEFKRWSRGLPVVSMEDSQAEEFVAGKGYVVQALHGTTGDFSEFKRQYANIESDLGGGFYFTNTHDDAGNNYAGEGPDLTGKLEREAERHRDSLEYDDWAEGKTDEDIDNEAWRRARISLNVDSAGVSMPVYVRFENPVVLGGSNETFLDYNEEYNEELDEYGEPSGKLLDVIEALRDVTADERYGDIDVEQAIGSLMDEAYDGGISADRAIEILTSSKGLQYATDYEDERAGLANKEIVRKAFEQAGFDGFIDQTVNKKFGSEKRVGKPMAGMDQGTVHYIAFKPTQIKSAVSNTGEFSDTNPDIRYSPFRSVDTNSPEFKRWFGGSKVVDAEGRPLVMYHGTTAEFNSFNPLKTPVNDDGYMGAGTYFIDDYRAAESYADMAQDNAPGEPRVVEVYLSIKNPYVMTEKDGQGTYGMTRDEVIAWTAQKKAEGYDGVTNGHGEWVAFSPTQIKSSISNTGEFSDTNPDIRYATSRSALTGKPINQTWTSSGLEKFDNFIRTMQDKLVDTKRVVEEIRKAGIAIKDSFNPYLQEILYHGRSAKQVSDFMDSELKPMLVEMHARGIEMQEMEDYLWARHAAERNAQIAKINTNMPDGGSGLTNQEASDILAGQAVTKNGRTIQLRPAKMAGYQSIAKRVQSITNGTLDLLVAEGLETQQTVDAWKASYKNYIPLMRDMESDDNYSGAFNLGTGKGFSVRGSASKRAMGSDRGVVDILANVAMQRERAITRAEKNKVAMAVYGLSMTAPNPDFWITINPDAKNPAYAQQLAKELQRLGVNPLDAQNIANEPRQAYIDPRTDMTAYRVNPALRNRADVLAVRLNGQDRYVMFSSDERAQHMVRNLKNLDADQLGQVMGRVSTVTRWFASINTQYNPIFGLTNGIRDLGTGALNLSSTSLKGKQAKVMKYAFSALKGIYSDLRDHRAGRQPSSQWALEFEEFQREGGQTGYKDMFATSADRTKALHEELKKAGNGESFWKVFSEDHPVGGWLSDYNTSIENAVRLAAYKAAKEDGLSIEQAAALAKGLTVNFNKKGLVATQAGALYAFFNAAVQGSARIAQTMVKDGKLTSAGQKILYGGLLAGVMQGVMASLAGWDDEEPPQFAREKNFLIPLPDGKYLSIPMPLGFHVIPNIGRISTEFVLSGFKKPGTRLVDLFRVVVDGFNPLGSSSLTQMIAPTVADPIVALSENKDFTGKSIYKEDFNKMKPTAGWTRTKDTASDFSKAMAYGMNYITGGGKHGIGIASPTPDQIDYLIGQATGGLGRESLKMWQAAKAPVSGEELPLYKVPVVGRFVGETTGQASEVSKFYNNLKRIGEHAYTIKSMEEAKDFQAKAEYLRENPDARMIDLADKASRELGYLKRMKRDAVEKGDKEKVVAIEKRITDKVKMYNGRLSEKQ